MILPWAALGLAPLLVYLFVFTLPHRRGKVPQQLEHQIPVTIHLTARRLLAIVLAIAVLNVLIMIGSFVATDYLQTLPNNWQGGSLKKYFLVQLYLGRENVIAAWYSSMLLALISLMSVFCCSAAGVHPRTHPKWFFRYGWLAFAAIFLALSFDEMGSLHERLGAAVLAIPVGVVGLFMLAFAWVHLRRSPWTLGLMVLGALLFLSVPLQEQVEMIVLRESMQSGVEGLATRPVLHLLLEEGAEIFGSLCFFGATAWYLITGGGSSVQGPSISRRFSVRYFFVPKKVLFAMVLSISLLGLAMMVVEHTVDISNDDNGIPGNWFPSVLAASTAVLCLLVRETARPRGRYAAHLYLALACFSLALSLYFGSNLKGWLSMDDLKPFHILPWTNGGLIAIAGLLALPLMTNVSGLWSRLCVATWVGLLALALGGVGRTWLAGPLDFAALAFLPPALITHFSYGSRTPPVEE